MLDSWRERGEVIAGSGEGGGREGEHFSEREAATPSPLSRLLSHRASMSSTSLLPLVPGVLRFGLMDTSGKRAAREFFAVNILCRRVPCFSGLQGPKCFQFPVSLNREDSAPRTLRLATIRPAVYRSSASSFLFLCIGGLRPHAPPRLATIREVIHYN